MFQVPAEIAQNSTILEEGPRVNIVRYLNYVFVFLYTVLMYY